MTPPRHDAPQMCATSFLLRTFKRVVNNPRSLCLVVGGIMSGALYLGGVMTVNHAKLFTSCFLGTSVYLANF